MSLSINNRFQNWLESHAGVYPDKAFIVGIDQEKSVTYADAHQYCCRIGDYLRTEGFGANDRVALMSNNSIEHLLTYIGVMAYGATICTIHVEMNALYIEEIIDTVRPKLVLFEDGAAFDFSAVSGVKKIPLGSLDDSDESTFFGLLAGNKSAAFTPPVNVAEDTASIFYTSGTSSKPKGVMYDYGDLGENAEAVAAGFELREDDRILDFRSFNWMSAQVLSALGTLSVGATLLLARKFSSSRFFDWIKKYHATIATGNPTTINMLINRPVQISGKDVPQLRFITSSSAPLLLQDWQNFEQLYDMQISQGYGSSETGWIAASNENCRKIGSVGKPLSYQKLSIVDETGAPVAANEIGYVELGPTVDTEFKYLGIDGEKNVAATGRVKTGDMGYLDDEGFLFISGRHKDLIIRGGINISPLEIENVLMAMPGIAEAAVLGVDDKIYGEAIIALVVPGKENLLTTDKVINHCQQNLSAVKLPEQVKFVDHLPKTDRGKLDRKSLEELWLQNLDH